MNQLIIRLFLFMLIMTAATAAAQEPAEAPQPPFPAAHNFTPPTLEPSAPRRICIFCHIPHIPEKIEPLWPELEMVTSPEAQEELNRLRKTKISAGMVNCLACHDGVLAKNPWKMGDFHSPEMQGVLAFARPPMGRLAEFPPLVDYPLSRYQHPVGDKMAFAQTKTGWVAPPPPDFPGKLKDGHTQCISCHNPHNETFKPFLAADYQKGQLCLNCHRMNP